MPNYNIPWKVEEGDQIRFSNSENQVYNVLSVVSPTDRFDGSNQLLLLLDRPIDTSIDKDFFIIRRYIYEPSSVLIDVLFPYGDLPTKKEWIPSTNNTLVNYDEKDENGDPIPVDGTTKNFTKYQLTEPEQSGSIETVYAPLLKVDNTPSGFLFPEYPVPEIELAPDVIMRQLRDNKLID
jgi:hypothetical protein